MTLRRTITAPLAALAALAWAGQANAHHLMGGQTPSTLFEGLLSGIGHPVIGIDHLAFIIAMGVAAAFTPRRALSPLAFVGATLLGCALLLSGIGLPVAEVVITASVVLVGFMVLSGRSFPGPLYLGIFAAAGLFHGWAYGESIIGAEPTPLVAYLAGFAIIQYALALAIGWLVRSAWSSVEPSAIRPRLLGAISVGVGFAFLIENIEALLLPVR